MASRNMQPCHTHDPAPAKLLLQLFVEDRTIYAGAEFEDIWKDNIRVVLNAVPDVKERRQWASAFSNTREAWRDAYLARGRSNLTILAEPDPSLTVGVGSA
jgi:hypothetical protein